MDPANLPLLLTRDEAAIALRLVEPGDDAEAMRSAARSVDHLVQTRRLRAVRVGKHNRFYREELIAFARRETEAGELRNVKGGGDG